MLLIESFRREKCTVQTEQERARNGKRSPVDGCCMQENKIHDKTTKRDLDESDKSKSKGKKQLVVIVTFGLYVCCFFSSWGDAHFLSLRQIGVADWTERESGERRKSST